MCCLLSPVALRTVLPIVLLIVVPTIAYFVAYCVAYCGLWHCLCLHRYYAFWLPNVLPTMQVEVWKQLGQRLRPGGRIIANISDSSAVANAIVEAFPGQHTSFVATVSLTV